MALTPEERKAIEQIANDAHKNIKKMVNLVRPTEPEPEPFNVERLLFEVDADLYVLSDPVRRRGILRRFAKDLWKAGYETGSDDVSKCCGCGPDATTPNPFDVEEAADG